MVCFKLMSYNVNGLGEEKKRRKIFNYLHEHKIDVTLIQEAHSCPKTNNIWANEWGGRAYFANGTTAARGVAILFRKGFSFQLLEKEVDPEGRYLILRSHK